MQVSIIIVNYNVKFFVEQCLYSVLKAVKNLSAEIIVFDNNSTDGSYSFLKDKFSTVKFIWNKNNEGFSRANNLKARGVRSKARKGKKSILKHPSGHIFHQKRFFKTEGIRALAS